MIDVTQFLGFAGIPVVIGLVQAAKAFLPTNDERYWPALALLIGVAFDVGLAAALHQDLGTAAVIGVVVGLTASGLYSHATTLAQPTPKPPPQG